MRRDSRTVSMMKEANDGASLVSRSCHDCAAELPDLDKLKQLEKEKD